MQKVRKKTKYRWKFRQFNAFKISCFETLNHDKKYVLKTKAQRALGYLIIVSTAVAVCGRCGVCLSDEGDRRFPVFHSRSPVLDRGGTERIRNFVLVTL